MARHKNTGEKGTFVAPTIGENDIEINIQTRRTTRSSGEKTKSLKFNEGDNIIHSKEDEQSLLFIISCLMNGVAELVTYYYNNKKL